MASGLTQQPNSPLEGDNYVVDISLEYVAPITVVPGDLTAREGFFKGISEFVCLDSSL